MSYSSVQQNCPPPPLPINLSSSKYSGGAEVKEEEELGQSQIKRHTIDAILGLPRFCVEEDSESGDLEGQRGKQKFHLERDGESPIWKYCDVCDCKKIAIDPCVDYICQSSCPKNYTSSKL